MIFLGLDFLHQAGIVHNGTAFSFIYELVETGAFSRYITKQHSPWSGRRQRSLDDQHKELQNSSARKVLDDRVIHISYTMPITHGVPVILDFGAARLGDPSQKHIGDVTPGVYRAPEVILGMEWDSEIDI